MINKRNKRYFLKIIISQIIKNMEKALIIIPILLLRNKLPSEPFYNNLDIGDDIANVKDGTANLLFWGLITPSTSDLHQSLTWCNPRFQGRGDDSVYNRPFKGLKTIVAVLCGLINSLITRVSINNSIFSTYLGNQNSWSLAIVNCFRPFCFAYKGS